MSVLAVGLSYRTAPIALLERAALDEQACRSLAETLCRGEHTTEAVVLSTCNRLEIYAEVSKFHGGVTEIGAGLAAATSVALTDLTDHLYVHYEAAAVSHLFTVACGLDSMAVGEQQILGQVRQALRSGIEAGSAGRVLGNLLQQALRVGKRAHAETGLDRAGHSLVEAGLDRAAETLGPLTSAHAVVIGAGAMSGLAAATLSRAGVGRLTIVNRTPERAERLAEAWGGHAVPLARLADALAAADLVLSCTGAVGRVIGLEAARQARAARDGRAQVYVDLALPHDVDTAVADLDGVRRIDLEELGRHLALEAVGADLEQVRRLISDEVAEYLAGQRADAVAPTVVALRSLARSVVDTELARLESRLGSVDDRIRAEVRQTVHRVVEKLLHTPTVRVKELAAEPGGSSYADALRQLFGLDPGQLAAVSELPETAAPVAPAEIITDDSLPGRRQVTMPTGPPHLLTRASGTLRLGTRRSALALAQSRQVASWIEAATARAGRPLRIELVEVTTDGDVSRAPLASFGGVGVFVSALRTALLDGRVDLAVHSLKDLPTAPAEGLALAAVPVREDPRDALVARDGLGVLDLPAGARVGTGSPRRAAQLRALGRGLDVVDLRGNVDTRLAQVTEGRLDAVVLALSGLRRLGRTELITEILDPELMLPAPGQGALAVECRDDDTPVLAGLRALDDGPSRAAVLAERALLAAVEAGCSAPLGALGELSDGKLELRAVVASVDGTRRLRRSDFAAPGEGPEDLGRRLAAELLAEGAGDLVAAAAAGRSAAPERRTISLAGEGDQ